MEGLNEPVFSAGPQNDTTFDFLRILRVEKTFQLFSKGSFKYSQVAFFSAKVYQLFLTCVGSTSVVICQSQPGMFLKLGPYLEDFSKWLVKGVPKRLKQDLLNGIIPQSKYWEICYLNWVRAARLISLQ